jgi:hypothetical protein
MEEKKIIIQGTSNRYQINKLKKSSSSLSNEPNIRKGIKHDAIPSEFYEQSIQTNLIEELYKKTDLSFTKPYRHISSEIEKKLASYKQQDILKKRYNCDSFITIDDALALLYECKLLCYYCKEPTILLYTLTREMKQWTLDRINNDVGHTANNVVISCLQCNLKRRRVNQDAFLFTKQLNIVKMDE